MRLFREITVQGDQQEAPLEGIIVKISAYLPDRPGSLEELSSVSAALKGNISFFYYNRSEHSNRVTMEVRFASYNDVVSLLEVLQTKGYSAHTTYSSNNMEIINLENILEIKVRLSNRPGSLAAFAHILKMQGANVIFMLYDEDIDEESATISMALRDPSEIDPLLNAINERGYHYRIIYRGSNTEEAAHIIGLKLSERFFIRL